MRVHVFGFTLFSLHLFLVYTAFWFTPLYSKNIRFTHRLIGYFWDVLWYRHVSIWGLGVYSKILTLLHPKDNNNPYKLTSHTIEVIRNF